MSSKNKLFKGAVAGATGVALLAGGLGSFALWSDQEALPSVSINTGQMNLAAGTATYKDVSPDAADTTWDPATDEMVPGDTVQVTIPYTANAEGKNLTGKLDFIQPVGFGGELTVTYDTAPEDTDTATPEVEPESWVTYGGSDAATTFAARTGDGSFTGSAVVTFALSSDATLEQAQNATVALNEASFAVTQTR